MSRFRKDCLVSLFGTVLIALTGAAALASPSEDAMFAKLVDPSFYQHPHRREALADALAVAETMLAATDGYNNRSTVVPLLTGSPGTALRALAAGGGRAGEIARVMLAEAEKGYFGDPKQPVHAVLPASMERTIEIAIVPGQTRRLILGTPGHGKALVGSTCGVELRELPLNERGAFDGSRPARPPTIATAEALSEQRIESSLLHFGVAAAEDCGKDPFNLLIAWIPSAPKAKADRKGNYQIRSAGRHSIPLSADGTPVEFLLPGKGYYSATVSPDDGELLIAGAEVSWAPVRGGAPVSGKLYAELGGSSEVHVHALQVTSLRLGETISATARPGGLEIIEVQVPRDARGFLVVNTFDLGADSDPLLAALNSDGQVVAETIDDESGGELNARLVVAVVPGSVQSFVLRDANNRMEGKLQATLISEPSPPSEDH